MKNLFKGWPLKCLPFQSGLLQSELLLFLNSGDKFKLACLFMLSIVVAAIEAISISLVMPFISVATNLNIIEKNALFKRMYVFLGSSSPKNFILVLGIILISFYIFRTIISIVFAYLFNRFAQDKYCYISEKLFSNYINLDYIDFVSRNSAAMHKQILSDTYQISLIISSVFIIVSELFTVSLIYSILLYMNWKMTLVLTAIFSTKIIFLIRPFFKAIAVQGEKCGKFTNSLYKIFNEAFGNFKMIKFLSNKEYIVDKFASMGKGFADSWTFNATFQVVPRLLLELFAFAILVSIVLYAIFMYSDLTALMPIVSMYAVSFYRFLPSVNKILTSYNQIIFCRGSIGKIDKLLLKEREERPYCELTFEDKIELKEICFSYPNKKNILEHVNLTIHKGEKVGFIGDSGVGKSTLVDLITGIHSPSSGNIFLDSSVLNDMQSWRRKIGYIPQDTYLFDGTVADNVVFGREYNKDSLIISLKKANIYSFLETQEGLLTKVGEGGVQLSGGQKQRISIARALYSSPSVLVLDEASSALDSNTESKIIKEIYSLGSEITLIIITHRPDLIKGCDKVYKIEKGGITEISFMPVDNEDISSRRVF